MPDFVPPGAPPAEGLDVTPDLLKRFATQADTESRTVAGVRGLDGLGTVEAAVPGAQLINGCIGIRQTVEPLIDAIYDDLSQLYLGIHAGIASFEQTDTENAARLGEGGGP